MNKKLCDDCNSETKTVSKCWGCDYFHNVVQNSQNLPKEERKSEGEGWYDVTKKLPDNSEYVLVYYEVMGRKIQTTARYLPKSKGWYDWCGDEVWGEDEGHVIAWRPLLALPVFS